ncbi:unnamed protein product [Cuscuta europaea]|uniref:DDT domain-containing protein n=1 Tax=Cuscuta europaea TaxID=41803 RepID=A0A9P0ZTB4_CUSEU|nr:unnamed protein product [Cuscuta europaea]
MPLYRRKPIPLAAKPPDLKPDELVFQVRSTKEIFRDYGDYVKRINLYKQRIWTCKLTGKRNLTYDEALVSEKDAREEAQRFPKELMAPVLRDVQFSMLSLNELANMIATKLQGCLSEGSELYGRMKNHVYPCKIIRVVKKNKPLYLVSWIDKYDEVRENTLLKEEDLILKKLPCSKGALKLFIRESTYHSFPWVLHDKLAEVHGIPTHIPEELKGKFSLQDGVVVRKRKREDHGIPTHPPEELKGKLSLQDGVVTILVRNRKRERNGEIKKDVEVIELPDDSVPNRTGIRTEKSKCLKHEECIESDTPKTHLIKYPIDDLLVQPSDSDKKLTERPCLQRDFNVSMHCVGDLLMVWDFGITFGKLLHLSPFSLEDFENAICHKDSNVVLIMEYHAALIRFLIEDSGVYLTDTPNRKHKPKITLITWAEYLSDFLETAGIAEMSSHISKIKCGQYGLLDIPAKLVILRELVAQALESDSFKQKLDGDIEKRQALVAAKRDEVMEEGRKRREEKERSKPHCAGKETINNSIEFLDTINNSSAHLKKLSSDDRPPEVTFKNDKKQEISMKAATECVGDSPKKEDNKNEIEKSTQNKCKDHSLNAHKVLKNEIKEALENRSKEQRRQYLEREIEKTIIRTNPLGKDRDYNTYWFFRRDARIFVESPDSTQWGYYRSKEEFDALLGSLNVKGVRERALKKQLEKFYAKISSEYQKKAKEEAQRVAMEEAVVRRSSRFEALPRPSRDDPALAFLKYINKWNTTRL